MQSSQGAYQCECISRHHYNQELFNPAMLVASSQCPTLAEQTKWQWQRQFPPACTENFAYKSAQGEIAIAPHMNSADDNSISVALEATLAYRY